MLITSLKVFFLFFLAFSPSVNVKAQSAGALYQKGVEAYQKGSYYEAIDLFEKSKNYDYSSQHMAMCNQMIDRCKNKQLSWQKKDSNVVSPLNSRDREKEEVKKADSLYQRGVLSYNQGRYQEAIYYFQKSKVLNSSPSNEKKCVNMIRSCIIKQRNSNKATATPIIKLDESGDLVVLSSPSGASVSMQRYIIRSISGKTERKIVEEELSKKTPFTVTKSPGHYYLTFSMDGFETHKDSVLVVPRQKVNCKVKLKKKKY